MKLQHLSASMVALSLALTPLPAAADFAGGLIGGIIGGVIAGEMNKGQRRTTTQRRTTSANPQREANREVQTALNYFNYPVGTPDGAIGPKSRAAISQYQAFLGNPATGQLTEFERTILVGAYNWGKSGAPDAMRLASSTSDGTRALLIAQRDNLSGGSTQMAGGFGGLPREVSDSVNEIARNSNVEASQLLQRHGFIQLADINGDGRTDYLLDTSVTGSAFWCNATACTVRVFASTPVGYQRNDFQAFNVTPAMFTCQQGNCLKVGDGASGTTMAVAPAPQTVPTLPGTTMAAATPVPSAQPVVPNPTAQVAVAPALPTFLAQNSQVASLASHCNKVSLETNTNGGFTTAANLRDPAFALSEQFCLARTYAMAQSEEMMARIQGFTPQQIAQQCEGFGPAMKDHVAALSLKSHDAVLNDVSGFVIATGMSAAQLADTARICLGVGYTTDNLDVAIGSALLLTVLGEKAYSELMGHHLTGGFGAAKRPDMGLTWFEYSFDDAAGGATLVFAPGMSDRGELIRRAAYMLNGRSDMLAPATEEAPVPAALPSFVIPNNAKVKSP
jgi:peptidoglycan hydrolase-like protein with peptidoglycan-binding domain